jgi:hypothetical protein
MVSLHNNVSQGVLSIGSFLAGQNILYQKCVRESIGAELVVSGVNA